MPGSTVLRSHQTELQAAAEQAVRRAEARARAHYAIDLPDAVIDLSLRGRCAGQARLERSTTLLRFNLQLLSENRGDFLAVTIPHEVAHLVVLWRSRGSRRRPKPHGVEWQSVMRNCFGLVPQRCHDYATVAARVVPHCFIYRCSCREHHLTSIIHNRIRRGPGALCRSCHTLLVFIRRRD
jgi:SprT protein